MDRRVDALDGWRAIAVAMVIACHMSVLSSVRSPALGSSFGLIGGLGVDYFFVISGFVIGRGLLSEKPVSLRGFYIRRLFRIMPPLLIYVLAVTSLAVVGLVHVDLFRFWRALTFTCNPNLGSECTQLGMHTWSLSVEEQFYLVVPVLIATAGAGWRTRLVAASIAPLVILLYALKKDYAAHLLEPFNFISAGLLCAIFERTIRRVIGGIPQSLAVVGLIATIFIQVSPATAIDTLLRTTLLPFAVASVLMLSALKLGRIQQVLSLSAMRGVGRVSYGIYLWQELATSPFPGAGWLFYGCSVTAAVALAFLMYDRVELPLIKLGRRISASFRPTSMLAAASPAAASETPTESLVP